MTGNGRSAAATDCMSKSPEGKTNYVGVRLSSFLSTIAVLKVLQKTYIYLYCFFKVETKIHMDGIALTNITQLRINYFLCSSTHRNAVKDNECVIPLHKRMKLTAQEWLLPNFHTVLF